MRIEVQLFQSCMVRCVKGVCHSEAECYSLTSTSPTLLVGGTAGSAVALVAAPWRSLSSSSPAREAAWIPIAETGCFLIIMGQVRG